MVCRIICLPRQTPAILSAEAEGFVSCVGRHRGAESGVGARVIYFWDVPGKWIYLLYGYVKNEREDLTPQQVKQLGELMKDVKHG